MRVALTGFNDMCALMTNFTKATETMKKHEQQSEHKACCARAARFITTQQGIVPTVHQSIVDHSQIQLAENVEKLTSLLRTSHRILGTTEYFLN